MGCLLPGRYTERYEYSSVLNGGTQYSSEGYRTHAWDGSNRRKVQGTHYFFKTKERKRKRFFETCGRVCPLKLFMSIGPFELRQFQLVSTNGPPIKYLNLGFKSIWSSEETRAPY